MLFIQTDQKNGSNNFILNFPAIKLSSNHKLHYIKPRFVRKSQFRLLEF